MSAISALEQLHDEVFRCGNIAAIDEITADDFVWRAHALPFEPAPGRAGIGQFATMLHTAFPDLSWQTEEPLLQNDRVVLRWTLRATHGGPLLGFEPTNHPILVTGIHIARIDEQGRIAELWQNWGLMGLMQQLGFLPIIGEATIYPIWEYPDAQNHTQNTAGASQSTAEPLQSTADTLQSTAERVEENENAILARRLFESVVNRGEIESVEQTLTLDCQDHNPGPSDAPGRDGIGEVFMLLHTAFGDLNGRIDDLICDGDRVAVRWTIGGTNTHRCMGIGPTHKRMENHGIDIVRVENGRIVERWGNSDDFKTLDQMGLLEDVLACPSFNPHLK